MKKRLAAFAGTVRRIVRRLTHDKLGWHDGKVGYGGPDTYCSICGGRVLCDSQGGWFLAHNSAIASTGDKANT